MNPGDTKIASPSSLFVVCNELVGNVGDTDKPSRNGTVDQRGAGPNISGSLLSRARLTSSRRDNYGGYRHGR